MADFRRPNITAPTTEGQLRQIKEYLFQFTDKLNYSLKEVEKEISNINSSIPTIDKDDAEGKSKAEKAKETFASLKNLIIKSADIVEAYTEVIQQKLSGFYVAQSDFGTYKENTDYLLEETSKNKTEFYDAVQEIYDSTGNLSELRKDGFYMRTGWIAEDSTTGNNIGGIELGQVSEDGSEVRKSIARFTTNELVFYDGDGTEESDKLAWLSKYKMNIRDARVDKNLEVNKYKMDSSKGLAFKWIG